LFNFFRKKPKVEEKKGADQRATPRFSVNEISLLIASGEKCKVILRDISLGGVRFETDRELQKDSVTNFVIDYNPINFVLKVHVLRCKPLENGNFEIAGPFINIPTDEMNLLKDHMETIRQSIQMEGQ
jgi:hypothetical protein